MSPAADRDGAPQRFAVCSFMRVFDTAPAQDAMTLPELTDALTRFLVKPQLRIKIERETAQIWTAADAVVAGRHLAGKVYGKLAAVAREAEERGDEVASAVRERARAMAFDVKRSAKRDFRLWAPALFRAGGKRDDTEVVHLSCLVLDYDDGTPIEEATEVWRAWFHLIHTTWSHTEAHHKFRVVLPLAAPVAAEDWRALWTWADQRTGRAIDPTGKSLSRAWAIPVVSDARAPRRAHTNPGPLLDAVVEGIVAAPSQAPVPPADALEPCLLRHDPEQVYVTGSFGAPLPVALEDDAIWSGGAVDLHHTPLDPDLALGLAASAPGRGAEPAAVEDAPAPTDDEVAALRARVEALERRVRALEAAPATVEALERLIMLHEQGAIDAEELAAGRRRVLGGDSG